MSRYVILSLLAASLVVGIGSSTYSQDIQAEPEWKYSVETEHYIIYTNMDPDFLVKAEKIAETAYTGAAIRLDLYNKDRGFIKNLELIFDEKKKFIKVFDNGLRLYYLPEDILLKEWSGDEITYEFIFPDKRKYTFWKNSIFGRKVSIYLCKDKKELRQNIKRSPVGTGRGGWYVSEGKIAISMDRPFEYENLDNLVHEIGHQVMNYIIYDPPVWVDEGLAMYAGIDSGNIYREGIVREKYLKLFLQAVERKKLVPVEKLIRLDYDDFHFSKKEKLHYAESWALVYFLLNSGHPRIEGKFEKYIAELRRGEEAFEAFREIYDIKLLEKEWQEYFGKL